MLLDIPDKFDVEKFVIQSKTIRGVDHALEDRCDIGDVILETLNARPDHVAQIDADTGRRTTLAEMRDRSVRCGLWLRKQGIRSGDIVTICSHNHLDTYVPIFATFYNGATFNAWNHDVTATSARHLMSLLKPKIIFACEAAAGVLLEAAKSENVATKIVAFERHSRLPTLEEILRAGHANEQVASFEPATIRDAGSSAIIVLSSGSTGLPKGVMHSYKNILNIIKFFYGYALNGVALWYSTCYWITGFAFTLVSFFSLGTRIIHGKFDAEDTCRVVEKYEVEQIFLPPVAMNYLCRTGVLERYKLESLKIMFTGGSKVQRKVVEELRKMLPRTLVLQGFGMSEAGTFVAVQTGKSRTIDSIGFVMPNIQVKIVDVATGEVLGPNVAGELCIKSPVMMSGYHRNAEKTKEAVDEEGWLHSGDKAYYNEQGEICITDRLKELMKYQNYQISPAEIEEVLATHPGVLEVGVVPIPHEIDGDRPLAYVKRSAAVEITEKELVELSATLGETKKLWGGVRFLEELPKNANGKINKTVLKEMAKKAWSTRTYCCKEDGCNGSYALSSSSILLLGTAWLLVLLRG